jgi:protoporphyrinogen oxidase
MKPIVIVGAGISGCVVAHGLAKRGYRVILIEKDGQIGGLAKTFRYGDFSFDIGPHRFFTQKQEISDFIQEVLKDNYTIISRNSEVYFLGKYYTWPLRPTVLFDLPFKMTLKSGWDLFLLCVRNSKNKLDTFEDYILRNYGPSLYNVFFKDYTEKFLGYSPRKIHSKWAEEGMKRTIIDERIASRNLFDILKLFLTFKPLQTEFIYPIKGIDVFCKKLTEEIREYGGEILTDAVITDIKCSSGKIEEVSLREKRIEPDRVIWTGSLDVVCKLLKVPYNGLEYLSLILFNIEIDKPLNKIYQWCYYGSKEIIFSRVTMHSLFSKNMAPKGKIGLCVEVTSRQDDKRWSNPKGLTERVKRDLVKVGLVKQLEDIGSVHIERISNAYPIYTLNYSRELKEVKDNLNKFKNLSLVGRTGLFWYNNMDDSIENGLETIRGIVQ